MTGNTKLKKVPLIPPFCAKSYFNNQIITNNKFCEEKNQENSGFVVSELVARSHDQDKCYENDSYDCRVMGLQ